MIRFVIKVAFFLGLIAMIVPGGEPRDGEPTINMFAVLYGAQAALSDLSGICDRTPAACAAGADVARFAGERVGDGLAIAYGFIDDAVARRQRSEPAKEEAEPSRSNVAASAVKHTAPSPRTDKITTAAIPATGLSPAPVPQDRAEGTRGTETASQTSTPPLSDHLPAARSRPLPPRTTPSDHHLATRVPLPVSAPRT
ncbi:DUF5330 domain-containing protein [Jiella mangrovi]|uniref:DUF5330 domain-containing protein n=1 Tax=Jiella mangrovi TaxID=2821407 RepID=A0ABS4BHW7_9HYPH|nr:DUF5330 domain-containing protein [Jiella mangrovi]MBP0615649.1 DUF5330 domain-containing protein [Jiella mangrovi]